MSNNLHVNNPVDLARVGNFTKNAVESFENGIIKEHNYLEILKIKIINKIKSSMKILCYIFHTTFISLYLC